MSESTQHEPAPEVHWVKPTLPTTLAHLEHLPIPGTDLIFAGIDVVWVYPGALSLPSFTQALSRALSDYPHAAGRLSCSSDGIWTIALTNSAIPITVSTAPKDIVPNDDLMRERHPAVLDPLPWSFAPTAPAAEPLVRFKYAYYPATGEFSLSISWCHLLGDGYTIFTFISALQAYYVGKPPPLPPTFEKYLAPTPMLERHLLHSTLALLPHLALDYDAQTFFEMYGAMLERTERVDLVFNKAQLRVMRERASRGAGVEISTQDALTAYIITLLNRVLDVPITRIMNVIDYRDVPGVKGSSYTPPPRSAIGNITLTSFSDTVPASAVHNIGQIASFVRATVSQMRAPESVRRTVSLSEELYTRSSNTGRLQWWWPYEGGVGVNNLYKIPTRTLHFTHPAAHTRFYTFDAWERYIRFWPANPVRRTDGTWDERAGAAHVFFRIKKGLGASLEREMKAEWGRLEEGCKL